MMRRVHIFGDDVRPLRFFLRLHGVASAPIPNCRLCRVQDIDLFRTSAKLTKSGVKFLLQSFLVIGAKKNNGMGEEKSITAHIR